MFQYNNLQLFIVSEQSFGFRFILIGFRVTVCDRVTVTGSAMFVNDFQETV
jgi:hypothetical protein